MAAQKTRRVETLHRPKVFCEHEELENVFRLKCLGSVFVADVKQIYDLETRIAMTQTRCGQLRHMLNSPDLSLKLKLRLYKAAVVSLLTFGCETWDLSPPAQRRLNNANSLMLARFTNKTIPQEARPATISFNLIKRVRINIDGVLSPEKDDIVRRLSVISDS